MNGFHPPFRAWLVFALVWGLLSCAGLPPRTEPPRVALIGLSLVSVELMEQRYQVRLRVKNPNAFELPIRGVDFRLDINGQAFADGVSNQSVNVPSYGEAVIELDVSSNLFQVFRQMQSLEQSRSPAFDYRISGNVATGVYGQQLPFDSSGELKLSAPDRSYRDKGV